MALMEIWLVTDSAFAKEIVGGEKVKDVPLGSPTQDKSNVPLYPDEEDTVTVTVLDPPALKVTATGLTLIA